jgi:peptide deformylase
MSFESLDTALPPLVHLGQPALMRRQDPVAEEEIGSDIFQARLAILNRCMEFYDGIGIAAPQVGWNARVFCMGIDDQSERYPDAESIPFEFWINPQIDSADEDTNWTWEGCLSVPGMRGWVERPAWVEVSGLDADGSRKQRRLEGFAARVFQHEFDHLDGKLFPMRIQDPKWLIPDLAMAQQASWQSGWPSAGAFATAPGDLSVTP